MIEGIVGLPGSGKSYYAVVRMIEAMRSGRRVLANFHPMDRAGWEFGLWSDMCSAVDALCVIDEAHIWFPSRKWQENTVQELAVWQQHRKRGLDLVWISQHEQRVDTALRELTAWVYRCRSVGGRVTAVTQATLEAPPQVLSRRFLVRNPLVWKYFDTSEIIGGRDGSGYGRGEASAYRSGVGRIGLIRWRLELPEGVKYLALDDPALPREVLRSRAYCADARLTAGLRVSFPRAVRLVSGGVVELSKRSLVQLGQEEDTGVEMAAVVGRGAGGNGRSRFVSALASLVGGPPPSGNTGAENTSGER